MVFWNNGNIHYKFGEIYNLKFEKQNCANKSSENTITFSKK